jgi:hypothetical protein
MRGATSAAALVLAIAASVPAPLGAQTAPETRGVIGGAIVPRSVIALRNNSAQPLEFWLHDGGGWRAARIDSRGEVEIRAPEAVLAIATLRSRDDREALAAPAGGPVELGVDASARRHGPFVLRRLSGGGRFELCWSSGERVWTVQRLGEGLCG